jgi:sugar lactone lactonase YvrE
MAGMLQRVCTTRRFWLGLVMTAILSAQTPQARPFRIVRLDPALDEIIHPHAKLEVLGEHFGLTEGPVWVRDATGGYLLFSDCAANVIYNW